MKRTLAGSIRGFLFLDRERMTFFMEGKGKSGPGPGPVGAEGSVIGGVMNPQGLCKTARRRELMRGEVDVPAPDYLPGTFNAVNCR